MEKILYYTLWVIDIICSAYTFVFATNFIKDPISSFDGFGLLVGGLLTVYTIFFTIALNKERDLRKKKRKKNEKTKNEKTPQPPQK